MVRGALGQAVKWGWLASNPARDATLPRATRQRITPPSAAKVRQLLALAEDHSVEMGMFIRLAALLGARRGEVCGLPWDDIEEASATIKIRRSVVDVAGHVTVKSTKTPADRVVAVDAGTLDLLRRYRSWMEDRAREVCTHVVPDAYIVSERPDGSKPMRPEKATIVFRALRDKVGFPTARLHDLRHFVATQMIAAGQDVVAVAGRLGHAQPSTTQWAFAAAVGAAGSSALETKSNAIAMISTLVIARVTGLSGSLFADVVRATRDAARSVGCDDPTARMVAAVCRLR